MKQTDLNRLREIRDKQLEIDKKFTEEMEVLRAQERSILKYCDHRYETGTTAKTEGFFSSKCKICGRPIY